MALMFILLVVLFVIVLIVVSNLQGRLTILQQQIQVLKKKFDELGIQITSTEQPSTNVNNEHSQVNPPVVQTIEKPLPLKTSVPTQSPSSNQPITQNKLEEPAKVHTYQQHQPPKPRVEKASNEKDLGHRLLQWFLKGNPIAKVAIIILFFGLSYLLKYSIDHGLLAPEIRIMGSLVLGLALLVIGWRLRIKKELYALILQGGAIGVLYFTLFAAFKLYGLVPLLLTFALLIVVCVTSVMFAVLQRAISLAIIACVGGYLAPILLSTNEGNHIALFSYYLLISSAILAISFWQSWRRLNLIGFAFTFIVALGWGSTRFQAVFYPECQLFILANMLIYGVLAVLLSIRNTKKEEYQQLIDLLLLFSVPLVGYGFQYAITRQWEFGPAFSALGFGLFYLLGSFAVLRIWHEKAKQLALYGLAIGLGFSTLAVPLALTKSWTALVWLTEGTLFSYLALRQKQYRLALIGVLIIALGVLSALTATFSILSNISFITLYSILSGLLLFNACLWHHHRLIHRDADIIKVMYIIVAALAWSIWIISGITRISVSPFAIAEKISVCYIITAWIWFAISRRVNWSTLNYSVIILWPVLLLSLAFNVLIDRYILATGVWGLSWFAGYASCYAYLYFNQKNKDWLQFKQLNPILHISLLWLLLCSIFREVNELLSFLPWGFNVISWSVLTIVAGLVILLFFILQRYRYFPTTSLDNGLYWLVGLAPIAFFLFCNLWVGLFNSGQIIYWLYIPILNPLEESAAFALMMMIVWLNNTIKVIQKNNVTGKLPLYSLIFVIAMTFLWGNSIILRSLSQWLDISWSFYSLWHNNIVQIVFSLVWTLSAVVLVIIANRYALRSAWFAGAVIQSIVVAKLVFIDSNELAGLMRAFVFIGVALLMLVIGYLAPLPPKIKKDSVDALQPEKKID